MKKQVFLALVSCLCWATMAPVSKLLFGSLSNMAVLAYGTLIGTILLMIIAIKKKEENVQYSFRDIIIRIGLGTLGYFLYSMFYYRGIRLLPAQTATILNYLWPIFTVFLAIPMLHESMNIRKIIALFISFFGVCIIVGMRIEDISLLGCGYCLLGALCYGTFNVLNKRIGKNQYWNMTIYMATGTILAFLCHMYEGIVWPTSTQWLGLLWIGVFADGVAYLSNYPRIHPSSISG